MVIAGKDEDKNETAGCFIYDCSINQWSLTPASVDMNMITARESHGAAVLDGKIVVANGFGSSNSALHPRFRGDRLLHSIECIDAHDILEYAPLDYPLPAWILNRVLQLGEPDDDIKSNCNPKRLRAA